MDICTSTVKSRLHLFLHRVELAYDPVSDCCMRGRKPGINIVVNIVQEVPKLRALDKAKWEVASCKELDIQDFEVAAIK